MSAREDALAGDLAARARLANDPIARIVLRRGHDHHPQNPHGEPTVLHPRELEVLRFASYGLTRRMIGDAMGIQASTVKTHLQESRLKLGAKNSTHAVAVAIRRGLIP